MASDQSRFKKTYSFYRQQPVYVSGGGGGGGGACSSPYVASFTNSDLVAGILTVNHGFSAQYVSVSVYDDSDKLVFPDEITATSVGTLTIDLTSYGTIPGTWHITIIESVCSIGGIPGPGGLNKHIQYNNAGAFDGDSTFTFDNVTKVVTTQTLIATAGLSGSLTALSDGSPYLIAGPNITINSQSNGSVAITGSAGGGGGDSYFSSTTAGSIFTTGSAAFIGNEAGVDSPSDKGSDVFFYVSGSTNQKSLFGGDVVISGSISGPNALKVTSNVWMTGSIIPSADVTHNLGTPTVRWANIYTGDLHLRNDRGDWTIVEEEDFLMVVNNKTNKKYKMALIPIGD
jgi:hypothetical protein